MDCPIPRSTLRALSNTELLHTLDTYLASGMQISTLLHERLETSKERDGSCLPPKPNFQRDGPWSPDTSRRETTLGAPRLRSPMLPFVGASTSQERIMLPPPRTLESPPSSSRWPGAPSPAILGPDGERSSAQGSSSTPAPGAGLLYDHYAKHESASSGDVAMHNGDNTGNSGSGAQDQAASSLSSGAPARSSSNLQLKSARHHTASDPTADDMLLTTAYGPEHGSAAQNLSSSSSEYPPRQRGDAGLPMSAPSPSASASFPHNHAPHFGRARANTISSMLDDSPSAYGGAGPGALARPGSAAPAGSVLNVSTHQRRPLMGLSPSSTSSAPVPSSSSVSHSGPTSTSLVDQRLVDLREDLQANRDRLPLTPSSSSSSAPGHSSPGVRGRSRSPPPHRHEYFEDGRYRNGGGPLHPSPPHHPQTQQHIVSAQQQMESNIPALGRKVTPALTVNSLGQRTCQQCHQPGRYKDGRCIEKWGPGPAGPGTVCDRCRKRMKRVERRNNHEANLSRQSAAQAQVPLVDPQEQQQQQQQQQRGPPPPYTQSQSQSNLNGGAQMRRPSISMPSTNGNGGAHFDHQHQLPPPLQRDPSPHHGHGRLSQMRLPGPHALPLHERHIAPPVSSDRMMMMSDKERRPAESVRDDGEEHDDEGDDDEEDELVEDYRYGAQRQSAAVVGGLSASRVQQQFSTPPLRGQHQPLRVGPPFASSRLSLPESQERLERSPSHQHPHPSQRYRSSYDYRGHGQDVGRERERAYGSYHSRSRSPSRSRSRSRSRSYSPHHEELSHPRAMYTSSVRTSDHERATSSNSPPSHSHSHSPSSSPTAVASVLGKRRSPPSNAPTMRDEVDDDDVVDGERGVVGVPRKMSPRTSSVSSPRSTTAGANELVTGRAEVEQDTAMA